MIQILIRKQSEVSSPAAFCGVGCCWLLGSGKQIKTLSLGWALGLLWGGSCGVMGLGAVDLWVGETNKNAEFGLDPWTAVGRELWSNGTGCC